MINLLPPQQQEELRGYRIKKITIVLSFMGTVFLIALALVLLALNFHLQGEVDYQSSVLKVKQGESKVGQIKSIQNEFSSYNKKISKLQKFYEQQDHPSEFLKKIDSVLSPSVYLTSLSYRKMKDEDYKARVNLVGYCPDRDILFNLKRKMDEKAEWKELRLPPSNWVQPVDINFQISFKIESETEE